jgi:(S)-2-hydroxyglutarate dehydrogenase
VDLPGQSVASSPQTGEYDVAVVGGGILGLAVARELKLRRPDDRLVVLEREPELARHQTGHNSGVVHAGIYYAPGSLKAKLCVAGARQLYEYCDEHGIPYKRRGKLIVACDEPELPRLDELERRGRLNEVPGLRRVDAAGIRELEPHCRGVAGLHSPHTGVVDFAAVARAFAAELRDHGAVVATGSEVTAVAHRGNRLRLVHTRGEARARFAVFCAGLRADELARLCGAGPEPRMVPFRGRYLRLRPERAHLVRSLIYPVPDPELPFLGAHLTRHVDGTVSLGPSALLAPARLNHSLAWPGTWRMARRWWRTGASELGRAVSRRRFAREAAAYVPELEPGDFEPWFTGVRAQAVARDGRLVDDFVVSETERALHVRNAPSPAATSALALARMIADRAERRLD